MARSPGTYDPLRGDRDDEREGEAPAPPPDYASLRREQAQAERTEQAAEEPYRPPDERIIPEAKPNDPRPDSTLGPSNPRAEEINANREFQAERAASLQATKDAEAAEVEAMKNDAAALGQRAFRGQSQEEREAALETARQEREREDRER